MEIKRRLLGVEEYLRDFKSLRNSISINGMMNIVHGLPRLHLTSGTSSIDMTFLMLSGIKTNAKKKNEVDCKKSDLKYLELERKLALYIDDELKIRPEFLTEFMNLYCKYFKAFFKENKIDIKDKAGFLGYVTMPIVIYTIYREKSAALSPNGLLYVEKAINMLLEKGFTLGGAVKMVVRKLLEIEDECLFIRTEQDEVKTPLRKEVPKEEKIQSVKRENPLDRFMENGRVVASCPLDEFSKMLESLDLSDNLKSEYYAQMKNFNNRKSKEELESELARLRADYLFDGEIKLYNKAKLVPEASGIIDDIDAAFLLLYEGVDPEEKEILVEEIGTLFESLKEMLEPPRVKEENEVPDLVYYLEESVINGETVKTPRILSTILSGNKNDNKAISIELSKLLKGNVSRDRELNGDFHYRVFYKGRDMRLFYLLIGGTVVVVDAFKGEVAFKKAQKLITSTEFRNFVREVQKFINEGGSPKATSYTELITGELKRSQEGKKMKFTKTNVNKTN